MVKKVLVTGINGFVGHHVAREMYDRGWEVFGLGTQESISEELSDDVIKYFQINLTNRTEVEKLPLREIDAIINLAGLSNMGQSFEKPELYMKINVEVLTILCRLLIESGSTARILAISTGALYDPHQQLPLTEESRVAITSPYSESKLLMEKVAEELRTEGLDCIVARPFNHFGPGQGRGFLIPDLKSRLLESKRTGKPVVVGNLKTRRDYTDVRDVAKAYADLISVDILDDHVFNVCSGKSRSGQEVLDLMVKVMGLDGKIAIKLDSGLVRPNDPLDLRGSYDLLKQATGWEPTIPFEQTIKDFLSQ